MSDCVIPARPHRAEAGLLICRRHLDQLAEELIDVEAEYAALDTHPSMAAPSGDGGSHHGLKNTKSPVRIDAVVARDRRYVHNAELTGGYGVDDRLSAFGVLHRWATEVRTGRDLQATGQPLTVHTERQVLSRHLEWAAGQPWIDECSAEIHTLVGQLQAVNGTADPGPLPGRCPRLDEELVECGGALWPVRPVHTSGPQIATASGSVAAVQCDRDSDHRWEGRDLVRLALVVQQQQQGDAA